VTEAADRLTNDDAISEILADWRRRLRNAPDLQPRQGVRGQRERSLTRALLNAADVPQDSPGATESLTKLAMIAALYGADQPRERLDPGALCEELAHLRQAVWHYLRQKRLNAEVATKRILAFDRALTLALRAALTGGYQCDGGEAELAKILPAIVTDSIFPPPFVSPAHDKQTGRR
jgi:hypothetical protein